MTSSTGDEGLRALDLLPRYRTGEQDLVQDFYVPLLSRSVSYQRAVGYFTSSSLALGARGLSRLVAAGGRVEIVASPQLAPEDIEALAAGYASRQELLTGALLRGLEGVEHVPEAARTRLRFLTRLIADGHLDLKIAVLADPRAGIYHEKLGIFTDANGDRVAFSGSSNESASALVRNFESFSVFASWRTEDRPRVEQHQADFDGLWNDTTPFLEVFDLPEAVRERLLVAVPPATSSELEPDPEETSEALRRLTGLRLSAEAPFGWPVRPADVALRDYQQGAIRAWFSHRGRGVWRMATGAGKTLTALSAMAELARVLKSQEERLLIVVLCPYQHLVRQWSGEAERFGIAAIQCFGSSQSWQPRLRDAVLGLNAGSIPFVMAITTNATFGGKPFQELVDQTAVRILLCADEVHNTGSPKTLKVLPARAPYRLGLSATPDRHMDAAGTAGIRDYFGEDVFEFSLERALQEGVLCRYRYHPVQVSLDADEHERYLLLSSEIARLAGMQSDELSTETADGQLKMKLFERARLLGGASAKVPALVAHMAAFREEKHTLVYCSDASVGQAGEVPQRQVDLAVRALSSVPLEMDVQSYTYEDAPARRAQLEHRFEAGDLQALVAIRCLDEGVDIPQVRRAFILASTTNPKQFIQRRGRVLRRAPGKEYAEIFDFVVVPPAPQDLPEAVAALEQRMFRKELTRIVEFTKLADNGMDALASLLPVRQAYNLLDV